MKRREMKFVAGSLQLASDRIEATSALRKPAAGRRRSRKPVRSQRTMTRDLSHPARKNPGSTAADVKGMAVQRIEPVGADVGGGAFGDVSPNGSAERVRSSIECPAYVAHHASNCRWATPTLFLADPYWWDAEGCPWACVRERVPRVLENTEVCTDCPHWEAHPKTTTDGTFTTGLETTSPFRSTQA
jgi:hypothetical protein